MSGKMNQYGVLLIALMVALCMGTLWRLNDTQPQVTYSQARQLFLQQRVESFVVDDNMLTLTLRDGEEFEGSKTVRCELYDFQIFYDDLNDEIQRQFAQGRILNYNYHQDHSVNWMETILPWILIAGLMGGMWYFFMSGRMRGMDGGDRMAHFGSARIRTMSDNGKRVTFEDVAGADEEKEELAEIVDFLKDPEKYVELGARIPKGVLLIGPPGTGKTLLAKAVAGEAQVGFLSISGSDFVELYVGVGASRVRDLFREAVKASPCIVFIDEIDAVGRQRGTGLGGGHDEREQTLNQLLVEMDGFSANEGVVVLAATNRADVLDPALLRPGRFDRQIYVGLPDIKGREDILKVHVKGKPLAEDVDLRKLAQGTSGFTGADLENLVNEGALLAARKNQPFITMADLKAAEIKVIAGPEKKSRVIPQHERELTAWHEAGHAVVMHSLPGQDPVSQISIVPRGTAGGMTIALPETDRSYLSKRYMEDRIVSLLGGRVAERLCLKDISTGASNDIQKATEIARKMVAAYGMSDRLGAVAFDTGHDEVFIGRTMGQARGYSESVAAQIDEEIKNVLANAYQRCENILIEHRTQLDAVARYLLEHETMERDAFLFIMGDGPEPMPPALPGAVAVAIDTDDNQAPENENENAPDENNINNNIILQPDLNQEDAPDLDADLNQENMSDLPEIVIENSDENENAPDLNADLNLNQENAPEDVTEKEQNDAPEDRKPRRTERKEKGAPEIVDIKDADIKPVRLEKESKPDAKESRDAKKSKSSRRGRRGRSGRKFGERLEKTLEKSLDKNQEDTQSGENNGHAPKK